MTTRAFDIAMMCVIMGVVLTLLGYATYIQIPSQEECNSFAANTGEFRLLWKKVAIETNRCMYNESGILVANPNGSWTHMVRP